MANDVVGSMVDALLQESAAAPRGKTVTWLNHYSVLQEGDRSPVDRFDYVGVDGIFLCKLLGLNTALRTSADLVMPRLLSMGSFSSVALVGGFPGVASSKIPTVTAMCREPRKVQITGWDGFAELQAVLEDLDSWYAKAGRPEVIVLGLGAPLQNEVAFTMSHAFPGALILTCGGWLDQVGTNYYPEWAYSLRLNWLVRLSKDPRRLAPRYSIHLIRAFRERQRIRKAVCGLRGFERYVRLLKNANHGHSSVGELATLSS